jgi:glycosyltransferase involved in cell wall biosynthesis
MSNSKKVSVIIPYRTDRGFLEEAIRSVENQTHKNIELILSQGETGVSENLNNGIKQSSGDFIKYLCDDDILPPDSIENSLKGFKKGIDFVHGKAKSFNGMVQNGIIYEPPKKNIRLEHLITHNYIHGGSLMYRREVFEEVGLFNESLWTGEEYEFNLRALSNGFKIGYIDKVLYYYRLHQEQKSIGNKSKAYQDLRKEQITLIRSWYI